MTLKTEKGFAYLHHVVSALVTKVSRSDLRTHVPPIEGRSGVFNTSAIKHHVGHARHCVPFQTQFTEPVIAKKLDKDVNALLRRLDNEW